MRATTGFLGKFITDSEVTENMQSRSARFGIVVKEHPWHAVTDLLLEDTNRWDGFQWLATPLFPRPDLSMFRQLTRLINNSHQENTFIETTLHDKLHGMQREYDRMGTVRGEYRLSTYVEVAYGYNRWNADFKCCESRHPLLQMDRTAIRSEMCVIEALGAILNDERPEMVIKKLTCGI